MKVTGTSSEITSEPTNNLSQVPSNNLFSWHLPFIDAERYPVRLADHSTYSTSVVSDQVVRPPGHARKPLSAAVGAHIEGGFELLGGGTLNAKISTTWLVLPQ